MRHARLGISGFAHQFEDAAFESSDGIVQEPADIGVAPG